MQPKICDHIINESARTDSGTPGMTSSRLRVSSTPFIDVDLRRHRRGRLLPRVGDDRPKHQGDPRGRFDRERRRLVSRHWRAVEQRVLVRVGLRPLADGRRGRVQSASRLVSRHATRPRVRRTRRDRCRRRRSTPSSRSSLVGKYRYSAEETTPISRATSRSDRPGAPFSAISRPRRRLDPLDLEEPGLGPWSVEHRSSDQYRRSTTSMCTLLESSALAIASTVCHTVLREQCSLN